MADIQSQLDNIRSAIYGEDVRGSIIEALETMNAAIGDGGGSGGGSGGSASMPMRTFTCTRKNAVVIESQSCRTYGKLVIINARLSRVSPSTDAFIPVLLVPDGYRPSTPLYFKPMIFTQGVTAPQYAYVNTDGNISLSPGSGDGLIELALQIVYICDSLSSSSSSSGGSDDDEEVIIDPVEEWYSEDGE